MSPEEYKLARADLGSPVSETDSSSDEGARLGMSEYADMSESESLPVRSSGMSVSEVYTSSGTDGEWSGTVMCAAVLELTMAVVSRVVEWIFFNLRMAT